MMEGNSGSFVVIDIEKLQNSQKKNLLHPCGCHASTSRTTEAVTSFGKVPQNLRDVYRNTLEPVVVSIGPYHHGIPNLQILEKAKWNCLAQILRANPERTPNDYIKAIKELCPLARNYYSKEMQMDTNKFVQMLLLDGCFILMALFGNEENATTLVSEDAPDNQITSWHYNYVFNDLLLLENQIPFFVVKKIYELVVGEAEVGVSPLLSDNISNFVEEILHDYPKATNRPRDFYHLLHLCHMFFRPSQTDTCPDRFDNSGQHLNRWHRAVQYQHAGIRFEKRNFDKNSPHSLLDVRLKENTIEIPCLQIDENTATIFSNLVALEQSSPQLGNDITAYIVFMSQLVSEEEDVVLFVSKGIIGHHFQSEDEVLNNFRFLVQLNRGVAFDFSSRFYLKNIFESLEAHYESRMKWWERYWLPGTGSEILG